MFGSEEFWAREFGLDSFDEFFAAVEPFLPSQVGYIIYLKDEHLARVAYHNRWSGIGMLVHGALFLAERRGGTDALERDRIRRGWDVVATSPKRPGEYMAPIVIPGVARVSIEALAGGQPVVNVVGVRLGATGTVKGAVDAVKAAWEGMGSPSSCNSTQYVVHTYKGTDLSTADGATAEVGSTQAGSMTAHIATAGACALVRFNGGTRARSGNGRMYLGPMTEDKINADGRTFDGAWVTTVSNNIKSFRDKLDAASYPLVVISAKTGTARNVVSHSVDSIIATQRRRIR